MQKLSSAATDANNSAGATWSVMQQVSRLTHEASRMHRHGVDSSK